MAVGTDSSKDVDHTGPSDPKGPTGQLCQWISGLSLEQIPAETQMRAKYLILDGLTCALVGAQLPWSQKAVRTILDFEPPGSCGIWGWDRGVGPLSAALLNSTFIQGFELDDFHHLAPLHSNALVLPALLAAIDHLSAASDGPTITGKAFLLSAVTGYEVGPRVGLALNGGHMLSQGWHSGAVFGPSASAAAVSKLLELDAGIVESALGTACTQACGLMSAQFESEAKRMQHGFAAKNGLFAALMAKGGYKGIERVYEREYGGFLRTFSQGSGKDPQYAVGELTKGLGADWQIWEIKIKPYAAMAGTFATIDCITALQKEHPKMLDGVTKIESVVVELGEAAFKHGGWKPQRPLNAIGAQMSASYVAAVQLIDHQVTPAQFRHNQLDREHLWSLVGKIVCRHNEKFDKINPWRQKVTIKFRDGEGDDLVQKVEKPKGFKPPLSNEEILHKWRDMTANVVDEARRKEIEHLVLGLEDEPDMKRLSDLLAGMIKNPIE